MTPPTTTTRLRPIIRVFVSSTFSDLRLERDALQARVYPKLEALCLTHGFQFQAIDLRWGVPKEAGLHHRTMRICFEELQRSQEISPEPNFLVLLGNRYGWRPLPEEISADEFRCLERAALALDRLSLKPQLVTLLHHWYRLDQNALTLLHNLRPRRQTSHGDSNLTDYTTPNAWQSVEQALWQIINEAYPASGLKDRFSTPRSPDHALPSIVRFQASATEQEIWRGALGIPSAREHVLAYFRELDTPPHLGSADNIKDYFDWESGASDQLAQQAQKDLKAEIRKQLGGQCKTLPQARLHVNLDPSGRPTATVSTDHLDELCLDVETKLTAMIDRQIKEYWREDTPSGTATDQEPATAHRIARELEIERDEHLRFGRERAPSASFVGRQDQLDRILNYASHETQWPLVIHGASGCGKTALLAHAAQQIAELPLSRNHQPIVRFIGVTPRSSNLRSLLTSLCQELRQQFSDKGNEEPLPTDVRELIDEFHRHLTSPAVVSQQPLILLLDALDQLSEADNARQLFWMPTRPLPGHVKLIVSCLSDREETDPEAMPYIALQRRHLPAEQLIGLNCLSIKEAQTLLFDRWLLSAGRRLVTSQRKMIEQLLHCDTCRQPLYLKLLFEEARRWHSSDTIEPIGQSVPTLLDQFITRISRPEQHGNLLVSLVLGYLAAARRGLTESEILEVLYTTPDYKEKLIKDSRNNIYSVSTEPPRIPIAIWSRLRSDLAPYLTERVAPGSTVLTFYHRQIAEWIKSRFVDLVDWNPISSLEKYFAHQPYFFESLQDQRARALQLPPTPRASNIRKVDELPWQCLEAAKRFGRDAPQSSHWQTIAELFTDLHFLESKVEAMLAPDLLVDFNDFLEAMPSEQLQYRNLHLLRAGVRRDFHFIVRHPTALFQCLWNSCWWYDSFESGKFYDAEYSQKNTKTHGEKLSAMMEVWRARKEQLTPGFSWIRSKRPPPVWLGSAEIAVLRGHEDLVQGITTSPDGRQLVSCSEDKTVRLWDAATGVELAVFRGHERSVWSVAFTPDGHCIVSGSQDKTVRIWDTATGAEIAVLRGHENTVRSVAVTPDGLRIISGSDDKTVRVWDVATGAETKVLRGHEDIVQSIAVTPDGLRIISGSEDKTVRIWDTASGDQITILRGHEYWITGVVVSPDGRYIVSCSADRTIRLWDAGTSVELAVLHGHTSSVTCVVVTPDSRRIISGSFDSTLRVWDATTGVEVAIIRGHDDFVRGVAVMPDGRCIISVSDDWTVRLWDITTFSKTPVLRGHEGFNILINCLVVSPNGHCIATGANDSTVRVWDAVTGMELRILRMEVGSVREICFSPDNLRIASVSRSSYRESTVYVWDFVTGAEITILRGHEGEISCVVFTPDGRHIISGSRDGTVRVWDAATGAEHGILRGHEGPVSNIGLTPDGLRVVSGSEIDTVRVWDLKTWECIKVMDIPHGRRAQRLSSIAVGGQTRSAFRDMPLKMEWVILNSASGKEVAWFPGLIMGTEILPNGREWAGYLYGQLHLLALEGAI